jgi:hypothetical protein
MTVEREPIFSRRVFAISDYEFSKDTLKFFKLTGFFKKRPVILKEIPVAEIENVESYWNELSITWNGVTNIFFKRNSLESFTDLRNKIRRMIEENVKNSQKNQLLLQRQTDYILTLESTFSLLDSLFDVLMALHEKRIDWLSINSHCKTLGQNLNLNTKTFPPLVLDFSMFSNAVLMQSTKEVADEALSILKLIYEYFNSLSKAEDTLVDIHPNFEDLTTLLVSYYTLNDLFLGKIVGDDDNTQEIRCLDLWLQKLAEQTNFKPDKEKLGWFIDRFGVEGTVGYIEGSRALYRDQLSAL